MLILINVKVVATLPLLDTWSLDYQLSYLQYEKLSNAHTFVLLCPSHHLSWSNCCWCLIISGTWDQLSLKLVQTSLKACNLITPNWEEIYTSIQESWPFFELICKSWVNVKLTTDDIFLSKNQLNSIWTKYILQVIFMIILQEISNQAQLIVLSKCCLFQLEHSTKIGFSVYLIQWSLNKR